MKAMWAWLAVFMLVGCLESNPQPSPGQPDTGGWTAADTAEPGGIDVLLEGDITPAPAEDTAAADVAVPEVTSDDTVTDLPTDDLCTPDCLDKECGDDGCGGICGTCPPCPSTECGVNHLCVATCEPLCQGKFCGDDGCGCPCGECAGGETCTPQGQCVPAATCTPEGQVLGLDPCCEGLEPRLQMVQDTADCPDEDGACCYSCQSTDPATWTCEEPGAGLNPCSSHEVLCHVDPDMDGVPSEADNCPTVPNPSCAEVDGDGIGDECDPDIDGDGVANELDCAPWDPAVFPGAANDPFNLVDDDCDGDRDDGDPAAPFPCYDDWIPSEDDNCPLLCNVDQQDLDGDGYGDPCDEDVDGDGALNEQDCSVYSWQIHPGAEELCNGVDDDCDGAIDEDCPCMQEFVSFIDPFPWLACCPGLVAAQACWPESGPECEDLTCLFECSCLQPLGFVCIPCGDGTCDDSESVCTCPEDCA